ncbi:MAG: cytochrome c maturation protein CcmE [Burkholderiaceae bacterium]|nr:cytochrome c maturation protein CcmE [Burkholderiaceae bacterium]
MTPRRKRLLLLLSALVLLVAAGVFVKQAFRSNLVFYVTPTELAAGGARTKETLRVGGMVQPGSLQRPVTDTLDVHFVLADGSSRVPVAYRGVLPDLFAEGKGAIAQGKLDASGTLVASQVLAKHDENYVPPKVHPQALEQSTSSKMTEPSRGVVQ